MFGLSVQTTVLAGIVTTTELVDAQHVEHERNRIKNWMARDEVRQQLTAQGVDFENAWARVDNLTNAEVMQLSANMDEMPAGSSSGEILVIGILVLVILELTGVTDLFTFI